MGSVAPIFGLGRREHIETVCGWLRDEVDGLASPVKTLAEDADAPIGTAKNWYARVSAPDSFYMSRLRAKYPNFAARMDELEGKQRALADDFTEILNTTFQTYMDTNPDLAKAMYRKFFGPHNEAEKAA